MSILYRSKFLIKYAFLNLAFCLFLIQNLNAENLKKIEITGNIRISDETIITFLPLKIGDTINELSINEITKDLYSTNFFSDIDVKFINDTLYLSLDENPIIQNLSYNGIKSDALLDSITEGTSLIERSSFNDIFLKNDLSIINNNLKNRGYFFSSIKTKIENLDDNKVNLIYDIELGDKAKINKISFIGNKIFKDKKLKSVIVSEESKFWKLLSGKKFLNEELVNFDKRLLKNFFLNEGYYNAEISSSYAKLINDNEFELIFNINAGNKYFFGNLNVDLPLNYNEENFSNLKETLKDLKGEKYSIYAIEKITKEIDNLALTEEYESIDVQIVEKLNNDILDLEFIIKESEKSLIRKINIFGNNVTRENVIRNQFEIDEGDFYNDILYNKSINNIKSLNFFKKVEGEILKDANSNDRIININVEEKPTGEVGASAGVGTSGNSVGFFIRENNYLGKGLALETNFIVSDDSVKGVFGVENPNYNDSNKSVYARAEATEIDKLKTFGYKTKRVGFAYGTTFEFLDDLSLGIGNKNYTERIETNSTASALQKKQEGNYLDSFLNLDFIYDKRNQRFRTTDGFRSAYSIDLPIISDNNTITNTFDYRVFTELYDDNVTTFSFFAKASNSLSNDNIKLTERNFLPARKLRGFVSGSVGPKDGKDFIGGNYASAINISSTLPQILESNENADVLIFFDAGNVWGVDYDSSIDNSNKIRSSIGLGVDLLTVVGPLNFSLSQPLTKADSDSTETFRFNLGTTF